MAQGMVALVPVLVTVVVLRFLLGFTAGILLPLVDPAVDHWPFVARAGLSLALLLLGLYLLGELTSRVVGRRILTLGETVVLKVPFVRTVYRAAKQVMDAFQGPGARAFKSVVYIDGGRWTTVFVPTTPNPTTGFLQVVREAEVVHTGFTVEEGVKMIMSLGALVPGEDARPPSGRGGAPPV